MEDVVCIDRLLKALVNLAARIKGGWPLFILAFEALNLLDDQCIHTYTLS